ncbi:ABC transporter ATP-binding protein [Paludicola sp. MB14-C6]|uniref:ABC transporter ATP-binding protein n=1 Tax=Paludihabitans sp. MB14-C6 TaxID=3070656 RepID=UPI0027DC9A51|nr:ABC transporter ATP-binding protein [Paludicola sp. MB14-C6]WMJ23827.1 ABC transporter ATP-binding protein [Paludicola sp. MB14-C6]
MTDYCLQIEKLSKNYQDFHLSNVNLNLPKGSIMGFVGENGAGKTTTIKAILNLIHKDSGTIKIFGLDHENNEKKIKQDIGVVLDESNFPQNLTPLDIAKILSNIYTNWDNTLFLNYLKRFALPEGKVIKEFSKGMNMKLLIACALAHKPKLLILDEATSGLDPVVRSEILDVFLEFIQDEEHSILLSSHITSDLEKVADYITFIHQGRILFSESKDKLIYEYGILKCKASDFQLMDKKKMIAYRKNEFGVDVLVTDKHYFSKTYSNVVVDQTSIDEMMLLFVKGERL